MYLSEGELHELMRYANNEGAKGKRLRGVQENPNCSAISGFWDQFIFIFDNGPSSATETPWPEY